MPNISDRNGKFSRRKGIRGEYIIRDMLRDMGYIANRVPLSGASEGFKGDVVAEKNGLKYIFEVKFRKRGFDRLYYIYHSLRQEKGVFRFFWKENGLVSLGYDLEQVKAPGGHFVELHADPVGKNHVRGMNISTLKSVYNMRDRWLGGCDFLVIKQNAQHPLFIKYW